ncbi:uncharacterized protein [Physcomitrium patens]|uniref:RING-type E3 ubiquitin transferase n=1 Tax=Physcomitrium patens TaxID=3218 RepID=A0A2K1IYD0_PHYPA|nr:uncharacterized protein LOC112272768 isoform X2 [Physcomitrium patens]PNR34283.1 hypothetical protein PHYPA_024100 [Physcomitrium patens]|eukprot:XP_024356628.1 uncharacterized protein LOC112272768 isoform X2 [Physcomitrella patens]
MRVTMKQKYAVRTRYLETESPGSLNNPYAPSPYIPAPIPPGSSTPRPNAFSPAVVAVIGVLAGAFLIVSYYRIFAKYCNRHHFPFWGTRRNGRDGGTSAIVLMEEHGAWPSNAVGLDDALISRIPTLKYDPHEGLVDGTECSVCLGEFKVGEVLRILPKCNHPFHIPCIDTWLVTSSTCPLCRVNIVLAVTVPYSLMPVEREPPAHSRGPTMSAIPASNPNPMQALINHEIEILQEQYVQEFWESGQLSGPPRSMSPPSSRGSFMSAPDVGTPDNHQIEMEGSSVQHSRHLSSETVETPTKEIHLVNNQNFTLERNSHLSRQLSVSTKRRLYSHARSERHRYQSEGRPGHSRRDYDHKGKHPLVPFPSPQMERFARFMGSSSARSTSSSSNQVVVELLAQEIFQHNNPRNHSKTLSESILETSVREHPYSTKSSQELMSTCTFSHRPQRLRHDNASFELMWSIKEQEHPPVDIIESSNRAPCGYDSLEDSSREHVEMPLAVSVSSDDEDDELHHRDHVSSIRSLRGHRHTRPSMHFAFKNSKSRFRRYGSVKKVHTSEPALEIFDV